MSHKIEKMTLPEYKNLDEKKGWFHQFVIESKKELDEILDSYSNGNFIYRGVSESKYKLFNSYQRMANPGLNQQQGEFRYNNRLAIMESQNYQDELLRKYLQSINCKQKDFATMSFLQHHGAPTPLLDFTLSREVGLFFMANKDNSNATKDIEKYFSLYLIDKRFLFPTNQFRKKYTEYLDSKSEEIEQNYNSVKPEIEFQLSMDSQFLNPSVELMDEDDDNYKFQMFLNNNLNIISQKGIFILNTYPNDPLEIAYKKDLKKRDENPNSRIDVKNFIISLDVNKKLRKEIMEKLAASKITAETVFPKIERLIKYVKDKEYET